MHRLTMAHLVPNPSPQRVYPLLKGLISRISYVMRNVDEQQLDKYIERLILRSKRKELDNGVIYDANATIGYIATRMLPTVQITERVLQDAFLAKGFEFDSFKAAKKRISILDFGSGPGSASWAVKAFVPDGVEMESTFVETSIPMVDAAMEICEGTFKASWARNLPDLIRSAKTRVAARRFDMVLCTFTMEELVSEEAKFTALSLLWESVTPGGLLVLIADDDSNGNNARMIGNARSTLISKEGLERMEKVATHAMLKKKKSTSEEEEEEEKGGGKYSAKIVAPCTHNGKCPLAQWQEEGDKAKVIESILVEKPNRGFALEKKGVEELVGEVRQQVGGSENKANNNKWCRFYQKVLCLLKIPPWVMKLEPQKAKKKVKKKLFHKGLAENDLMQYNYEFLKFSYLVAKKVPAGEEEKASSKQTPPASEDGGAVYLGKRILEHVRKNPQHVIVDLCQDNQIDRVVVTAGKSGKENYAKAKNASWGEMF